MIGRKGDSPVISPTVFRQLELKHHFPFEIMKKNVIGYVCTEIVWILYKEDEAMIKTPFARNRLWFKAIVSCPEFAALGRLSQIYIV